MGNTCGCTDDNYKTDALGVLKSVDGGGQAPYKVADHQSRLNARTFASMPEHTKNDMLIEAFQMLVATVEHGKIHSTNLHVKRLLSKEVGASCDPIEGISYTGEYVDGVANGIGKIRSLTNDDDYDGPVFNGKRHGQGKMKENKPAGVSGVVTYYKGVAVGKAQFIANASDNFKRISEGGFDSKGRRCGPYICESKEGDLIYEIQSHNVRDGPFVVLSNDGTTVAVTEFKGGKEVGNLQFYTGIGESYGNGSIYKEKIDPSVSIKKSGIEFQ